MSWPEAITKTLGPSDPEVHFELLDVVVALGVPLTLVAWLRQSGEYALWAMGIATLDYERVVDGKCGCFCHGFSPLGEILKQLLQYRVDLEISQVETSVLQKISAFVVECRARSQVARDSPHF